MPHTDAALQENLVHNLIETAFSLSVASCSLQFEEILTKVREHTSALQNGCLQCMKPISLLLIQECTGFLESMSIALAFLFLKRFVAKSKFLFRSFDYVPV